MPIVWPKLLEWETGYDIAVCEGAGSTFQKGTPWSRELLGTHRSHHGLTLVPGPKPLSGSGEVTHLPSGPCCEMGVARFFWRFKISNCSTKGWKLLKSEMSAISGMIVIVVS